MLTNLTAPEGDKILALMLESAADTRPDKIDLGVGVYKDADGNTPVMRAVHDAERRIWETETTKTYTAMAGAAEFSSALGDLVLGDTVPADRRAALGTPGGTGAVRQMMELVRHAAPGARVWVSRPTWPNHLAILKDLGIETRDYAYFDPATGRVDTDAMLSELQDLRQGDVVLLHGCCHNPTGADLTPDEVHALADLVIERGAEVAIDLAYLGFGDGLEADAETTRILARRLPQLLVAVSCSKNFGIYRERTGLILAVAPDAEAAKATQGVLQSIARAIWSFPPDHGARIVSTILTDETLRADWQAELTDMREGMLSLRRQLADELRRHTNSDRFDFVAEHRGMFSRLGLSPETVETLKRDHGVYMLGDSRINVAGLNAESVPRLAAAIAQTL